MWQHTPGVSRSDVADPLVQFRGQFSSIGLNIVTTRN